MEQHIHNTNQKRDEQNLVKNNMKPVVIQTRSINSLEKFKPKNYQLLYNCFNKCVQVIKALYTTLMVPLSYVLVDQR